ncbi:hypothetical protein [Methylobacterium gregans]|uniref:hypothetical protein n=1 Tax=Methylobacterium gregans TaxID=374424 RepID=UPI00361A8ADB
MSDPSVRELIDQAAADAAEATRPALESAVRTEVEREMAAERAAAHEQVRALIAGLEAEEIAALEARCAAEAAKRDEDLAEARRRGMKAVEAATAERLREAEDAAAGMDARRASLAGEVEELEGRRQGLAASVAALADEERSKLEIVERLVKAGEDAAALRKPAAVPAVLAPWPPGAETSAGSGCGTLPASRRKRACCRRRAWKPSCASRSSSRPARCRSCTDRIPAASWRRPGA